MGTQKTETEIKQEARVYQNEHNVKYMKALDEISKIYGYKNWNVLKTKLTKDGHILTNAHAKKANPNIFNLTFNTEVLDRLLEKGIINNANKDDISVLAWSNLAKLYYHHMQTFSLPFFDLSKSEKNLSYREKVAQSIAMMGYATDGSNTGRGSSYSHRDYFSSDFDGIMCCGNKVILEDINCTPDKARVRANGGGFEGEGDSFFVEYNFEKEETTLYVKSYRDAVIDSFKKFMKDGGGDIIIPFSVFKTFPFYNVQTIVLMGKENLELTKNTEREVKFERSYFSM